MDPRSNRFHFLPTNMVQSLIGKQEAHPNPQYQTKSDRILNRAPTPINRRIDIHRHILMSHKFHHQQQTPGMHPNELVSKMSLTKPKQNPPPTVVGTAKRPITPIQSDEEYEQSEVDEHSEAPIYSQSEYYDEDDE